MDTLINGMMVNHDTGSDEMEEAFKDVNQFIVYAAPVTFEGVDMERIAINMVIPHDFTDEEDLVKLKRKMVELMIDYES